MQKLSKILMGIGVVLAIVALGILVGWWGSRDKTAPARPSATPTAVASTSHSSLPIKTNESAPSLVTARGRSSTPPLKSVAPGTASTNLMANWEDKLDDVLGSDDEDTNKVKQLFEMFPRLPEEGQEEVAQHLSNLVPDDDYTKLGQLLLDAKLPEAVLDVLMSDVLNRPNSVKLPLLLKVAQNPDHAKAEEAKDLLELYLDEEDPAKWPEKMQEWLKENPD
jgi:hypothetical protein